MKTLTYEKLPRSSYPTSQILIAAISLLDKLTKFAGVAALEVSEAVSFLASRFFFLFMAQQKFSSAKTGLSVTNRGAMCSITNMEVVDKTENKATDLWKVFSWWSVSIVFC